MGLSSSHEKHGLTSKLDLGDYHVALVQDQRDSVEAYIDNNRDVLKLASTGQPWWSNRLIHRAFMVKRKLIEIQRFLQRLGTREAILRAREPLPEHHRRDFWGTLTILAPPLSHIDRSFTTLTQ